MRRADTLIVTEVLVSRWPAAAPACSRVFAPARASRWPRGAAGAETAARVSVRNGTGPRRAHLKRLQALVQLLDGRGAQQQALDRLVLQRPGDRQLRGAAAELLSQQEQVAHLVALPPRLVNLLLRPVQALQRNAKRPNISQTNRARPTKNESELHFY